MITLRSQADFGAGPTAVKLEGDPLDLVEDKRLVVVFADCEMLFTVVGRVRNAVHLGGFLSPWSYVHWRLESRAGQWLLSTSDRVEIERLRRFYVRSSPSADFSL